MNKTKTYGFLAFILATVLSSAHALSIQDGTRIRFQTGRTSATVNGTAAQGGPDFYKVGARKGQTMVVHVDGDVTFGIDSPRGQMTEDDGNTSWRAENLDFDGDYTIRVYSARNVQKYSLTVSIR